MKNLHYFSLTILSFLMLATSSYAASGLKERCDGYVTAMSSSAKTKAKKLNDQRKNAYKKIATKRGVSINDVAKETGKKLCR